MNTYNPAECACFLNTTETYGAFSNFAIGYPISVSKRTFYTSEALYQACRFPNYPDLQLQLTTIISPYEAKKFAMDNEDLSRIDWLNVRIEVMRWVIFAKLFNNWDRLANLFTSTKHKPIVEISKHDKFWGAVVQPDVKLIGQNNLGLLLMEARSFIIATFDFKNAKLSAPPITNFLLFGERVPQITVTTRSNN